VSSDILSTGCQGLHGKIVSPVPSLTVSHLNSRPLHCDFLSVCLLFSVKNLPPDVIRPVVKLTARGMMPYCHLDIPESNYLTSGLRDYTRPGPVGYPPGIQLDPGTKVVEMSCLGVGVTHTLCVPYQLIHLHSVQCINVFCCVYIQEVPCYQSYKQ
jgi:hypothetical protein